MSTNYIPKIVYGGTPTTITFTYPPTKDTDEERKAQVKVSASLSGVEQTALEYVEATRTITFDFLTSTLKSNLETFFDTHASYGYTFKFYDHAS